MKRFRFTLLAVCLVLLYLGATDVSLSLRNREPLPATVEELERSGAPREWLTVSGGHQNVLDAINMTGTIEIDALLVPLTLSPEGRSYRVLFETRDPQILDTWKTYYFKLDSPLAKETYLAEHRDAFFPRRELTGMVVGGLVASGNRDKLLKLAREVGMDVADDAIFISEGKEPPRYRGGFFLVIALLGLVKIVGMMKKAQQSPPA
ncbi:MAG: hypothetical protein C0617_04505 [Desulfuromonas sp.]|uniref:hypothetical protein n=1 Tax=Desulfuromonas sp. TaxID=892 RepID=UPI000CAE6910|nr:hypothetical protein [Desulfuromonas sp.]PLX85339.1 MAG: hypothetical protein C0617_04505 [Desulfuromonas sp.]